MRKDLSSLHLPHDKHTAGCAPVRLEGVREVVLPMKMHSGYDAEIVVQVGEAVTLVCALVREARGSATIRGRPAAFLEPVKIPILAGAYGGDLVMAFVLAAVHAICGMRETEEET